MVGSSIWLSCLPHYRSTEAALLACLPHAQGWCGGHLSPMGTLVVVRGRPSLILIRTRTRTRTRLQAASEPLHSSLTLHVTPVFHAIPRGHD